jgi:hypothetical protein
LEVEAVLMTAAGCTGGISWLTTICRIVKLFALVMQSAEESTTSKGGGSATLTWTQACRSLELAPLLTEIVTVVLEKFREQQVSTIQGTFQRVEMIPGCVT